MVGFCKPLVPESFSQSQVHVYCHITCVHTSLVEGWICHFSHSCLHGNKGLSMCVCQCVSVFMRPWWKSIFYFCASKIGVAGKKLIVYWLCKSTSSFLAISLFNWEAYIPQLLWIYISLSMLIQSTTNNVKMIWKYILKLSWLSLWHHS